MKHIPVFILIIVLALIGFTYSVHGATILFPTGGGTGKGTFTAGLLGASGTNPFFTQATTTVSCSGSTTCTSFTAIGGSPITISSSGGGGGGSSSVATSSAETNTYVPFWASTGATPALLSGGESTFTYDSSLNKLSVPSASTTDIGALSSAGIDLHANSGAQIANFGAGSGQGATFYGGVNIDGATRLATSLTGFLKGTSGVVSSVSSIVPADFSLTKGNFLVGNDAGVAQATSSIFVSSTGLIGIGTTTPTNTLGVQGDGLFSGNLRVAGFTATGTISLPASSISNATLANSSITVSNGGGLSVSGSPVSLGGTVTLSLNTANANTWTALQTINYASTTAISVSGLTSGRVTYAGTGGILQDSANLVFTGTNLGIGTTTPSTTLFVQGKGGTNPFAVASSTGTNLLTLNQSGFLGLGTTLPTVQLQVESNTNASQGAFFRNLNSGTGAASVISVNSDAGQLTFNVHSLAHSVWPATGLISASSGLSGGLAFNTASTTPIRFFTNNGEKARLDSNGNFGIGTSSPFAALSVSTTTANYTGQVLFAVANSSNKTFLNVFGNGRVGVGTTSPYATVSIADAGTSAVTSLAINNRFRFRGDGVMYWGVNADAGYLSWDTNQAIIGSSNSNSLVLLSTTGTTGVGSTSPYATLSVNNAAGKDAFAVGSSTGTYFLVNSLGNVGIGSSTPFAKLSVKGAGTTTGINFQTTDSANLPLFTILDNGNVGIGTSTPGFKFQVSAASAPQIALSDNSLTSNHWTLRSITNSLFFSTSSPSTYATSSASAISIDPNAVVTIANKLIASVADFTAGILRLPYSASPTMATNGDTGIDSTADQFKFFSSSATRVLSPNIDWTSRLIATSTMGQGTTTIKLGGYKNATTFTALGCITPPGGGSFSVQIGDGTASSTAVGSGGGLTTTFTTLSSNNAFTAGEAVFVAVGSASGSVSDPSCSFSRTLDAQ